MKVWCPRCDPNRQQQQPNQSHKRQRDNEGESRAAKAQSVDLTGDDMMNDEEEDEFDDGDDMDEDHQEDGEQDEEEGQGSETYAAQSNKATKKVKNFTEVMQRPDSAFCASKARRKQQLGAAQTRGRNPKKIQGSRVEDVKKDTLMKRTRTRTTKCRMGGSAQRRLPGAWAGTGAPRRIFGWGTLPLRCLIGVGVAACSVCLSVCFRSRVVVGVWLACHPASGLRSANHSCLGGAVVCN